MIRTLTLATILASALTVSALAADQATAPATETPSVSEYVDALTKAATADQVRKMLMAKGYTNVSDLAKDESGRWTGSAVKDGKTMTVSVAMPEKGATSGTTN